MSDDFQELVAELHSDGYSIDPPYLHGLLTGFATTPDPDLDRLWQELGRKQPLADSIQEEILNNIDFLSEDLSLFEFEAQFQATQQDEPERWIKGYFRAVELHEAQWEEYTKDLPEAGMVLTILNSMINEELRNELGLEQSGPQELRSSPEIVTELAQAIYLQFITPTMEENDLTEEELPPIHSFTEEELTASDETALFSLVANHEDRLPLEVVHECANRGEKMVPLLQKHLQNEANWSNDADIGDWWGLLHATFILGLIPGEASATALLEGFRRITYDSSSSELPDWTSGYWPALCRNKSDYTSEPMRQIAEDKGLDWYPRSHAVECVLAEAAASGAEQLESAVDWLATLCADETEELEFRHIAAGDHLLDFPRARHRPLMEQLDKLQDPDDWFHNTFNNKDIDRAFSRGDQPGWDNFENPWQFYDPEAIIKRQLRWVREDREREEIEYHPQYDRAPEEIEYHPQYDWAPVETYTRNQPKTGRNDPCPCGSGKKYKKCCLSKLH